MKMRWVWLKTANWGAAYRKEVGDGGMLVMGGEWCF